MNLAVNEYGTPISTHQCSVCGRPFTVCPPATKRFGTACLAFDCDSYDVKRDVDLTFEVEPWRITSKALTPGDTK